MYELDTGHNYAYMHSGVQKLLSHVMERMTNACNIHSGIFMEVQCAHILTSIALDDLYSIACNIH